VQTQSPQQITWQDRVLHLLLQFSRDLKTYLFAGHSQVYHIRGIT